MVAGAKHFNLNLFNKRQINRNLNTRRKDQQDLIQLVFDRIHHSKNVHKPMENKNIKLIHPNDPVNMHEVETVKGCVNGMKEDLTNVMENVISGTIPIGNKNIELIHPNDPVNIVNLDTVKGDVNEIKEDMSNIIESKSSSNVDEGENYMNGDIDDIIKEKSNANNHAISYKTKSRKLKKIKKNIRNKTNSIIVGNCIANANEPSFYTNNDKFLLHTKVFNKTVCFEIDSGATFSIISLDILLSLNKNFRQHCKKYKEQAELTGVSGTLLKIDGVYAIPLEIPIIGRIYHKIYVIKDVQVNLLGREFFFQTGMSLIFNKGNNGHPNYFSINFKNNKNNNAVVSNTDEISLAPGQTKICKIECPNLQKRKSYELALLDRKEHVVMPDTLSDVKTKNKNKFIKIAIGNTSDSIVKIPKFSLKILAQEANTNDRFVPINDVTEEDLGQGPINLITAPKHANIPDKLKPFYDKNGLCKDLLRMEKHNFKMNKVCTNCIMNKRSYNGIHRVHVNNQNVDTLPKIYEKESQNDKEDTFLEDFKNLDYGGGEDISANEIGIPTFKTQEEIEINVHNKLKDLPIEIYDLLKPAFLKNEALMKSSWDVPVCQERLHFELKAPIPRQTRIYPIKEDFKSAFFSTLQYMIYFNILERCDVSNQFGSPVFCIPRAATAANVSRPLRILADMRVVNSYISESVSASMESCWTILHEVSSNAQFFSSLDLTNMFYSCQISQEILKSGFQNIICPFGSFRLLRLASGCSLSPSFASGLLMKKLYTDSETNWQYIQGIKAFYDDLTISSKVGETLIEHAEKVAQILDKVNSLGFAISLEKSVLCKDLTKESVEVLGFKISSNKITITDKRRQNTIECIKTPTNLKQLQRILGQINYLRYLLKPEHLHSLAILPTKMKKHKLIWDDEGEQCLKIIKEGLLNSDMQISIPPTDSINVLFSDSSELAIAGVLFYVPISNFDMVENSAYKTYPMNSEIKTHIDHHNIVCSGITEIKQDIMEFCYDVYYTYVHSTTPSSTHVLSKLTNQLIESFPEFIQQIVHDDKQNKGKDILKQIICDLQERKLIYKYLDCFLIQALSKILNRQILFFDVVGNKPMKKPYIKIGHHSECAPVFIAYCKQGYQLIALEQNFENQKRFSRIAYSRDEENRFFFFFPQI